MSDTTPWVIEDANIYHAKKDHMSATQLKLLAQSARHYKKMYLDQIVIDTEDDEPTLSMRLGRMIHFYLLEPEVFREKYAFLPDKADERFKKALFTLEDLKAKCKEMELKSSGTKAELCERILEVNSDILIWDRYITELTEGKEAITVERQHMLLEIFDAVKTHPVALKLIKAGIPEVSGYWHDDEFGIDCKFRTDWINEKGYIVELKSTTDARKRKFFYKIKDMRYDIGAAWYVRGYKKLMNREPKGYVWMVVETKRPFSVACYTPDESLLSAGEFGWDGEDAPVGFREALEVFKKTKESGAYPGFQTQVETIDYKSYEKIY